MNRPVSHLQAIGFALAGFAFWVLCDTCIKLTRSAALPPYEMVCVMGLSGATLMLVYAFMRGEVKTLWPKRPRGQIGRALLSLGIAFCNVIALKHLPLAVFYVMIFMSPMIVAILAATFLHERLDLKKIIAVIAGFSGVIIAIHPGSDDMRGDWIGYVVMIISAFIFSINAIWLRRMTQNETVVSMTFLTTLSDIVGGGVPMLWHAEPVGSGLFLILTAAGILSIFGSACYAVALRHTTAATVAQIHYTQIIIGALMGYLIWHEIPTWHLATGAVVIIASGLYIATQAHKTKMSAAIGL